LLLASCSADLRPGADSGGVDDPVTISTLTNPEVIAVNQDELASPMRPIWRRDGLEVWRKPLSDGSSAVIFFYRNGTQPAEGA